MSVLVGEGGNRNRTMEICSLLDIDATKDGEGTECMVYDPFRLLCVSFLVLTPNTILTI